MEGALEIQSDSSFLGCFLEFMRDKGQCHSGKIFLAGTELPLSANRHPSRRAADVGVRANIPNRQLM
jgi:hypothetical protein